MDDIVDTLTIDFINCSCYWNFQVHHKFDYSLLFFTVIFYFSLFHLHLLPWLKNFISISSLHNSVHWNNFLFPTNSDCNEIFFSQYFYSVDKLSRKFPLFARYDDKSIVPVEEVIHVLKEKLKIFCIMQISVNPHFSVASDYIVLLDDLCFMSVVALRTSTLDVSITTLRIICFGRQLRNSLSCLCN